MPDLPSDEAKREAHGVIDEMIALLGRQDVPFSPGDLARLEGVVHQRCADETERFVRKLRVVK